MKLFYEYMVIFFNLSPTSSNLYPPQAENCDSNSLLVVDEDDNVKSGMKGLNQYIVSNLVSVIDKGKFESTVLTIN